MRRSLFLMLLVFVGCAAVARAGVTLTIAGGRGSQVYLDGVYAGTAPLTIKNVSGGLHQLAVVLPDGELRRQLVRVAGSGAARTIDVREMPVELGARLPGSTWWGPFYLGSRPFWYDDLLRGPLGHPVPWWSRPHRAVPPPRRGPDGRERGRRR